MSHNSIQRVSPNKKSPGILKRLQGFVKGTDQFGHPIRLTYKNNDTYKTLPGGIVTLILRIAILVYFITEVVNVFQKKSTVTNSSYIRNTAIDTTEYHLDQSKWDIAFNMQYQFPNDPKYNINTLHRYVNLKVEKAKFFFELVDGALTWNTKTEDMELVDCPEGRFLGETQITQNLGIGGPNNKFKCPKDVNLTLQGGFSSPSLKMLRTIIVRCENDYLQKHYPNETCGTKEEIDAALDNVEIYMPVINQYFDEFDHSDNPIKTNIENLYFQTTPALSQLYYIKIGQNYANIRDSAISKNIGEKNLTYYTVRTTYQNTKTESSLFRSLNVVLFMDDVVKTTQREAYTIADALSATGGFLEILRMFGTLMVGWINFNLFFQSIIKKFFTISENDDSQVDQIKAISQVQQVIGKNQSELKTHFKHPPHQTSIQSSQIISQTRLDFANEDSQFTLRDNTDNNSIDKGKDNIFKILLDEIKSRKRFKYNMGLLLRYLTGLYKCKKDKKNQLKQMYLQYKEGIKKASDFV
eukprot:403365373